MTDYTLRAYDVDGNELFLGPHPGMRLYSEDWSFEGSLDDCYTVMGRQMFWQVCREREILTTRRKAAYFRLYGNGLDELHIARHGIKHWEKVGRCAPRSLVVFTPSEDHFLVDISTGGIPVIVDKESGRVAAISEDHQDGLFWFYYPHSGKTRYWPTRCRSRMAAARELCRQLNRALMKPARAETIPG